MNLNPLKKDDNTDALVKALEDANAMGGDQPPVAQTMPTTDGATIAADPQVVSSGVMPQIDATQPSVSTMPDPIMTAQAMSEPTPEATLPTSDPASDQANATTPDTSSTDTTASIAFSGNDLPEGLSSDASAHLPADGTGDNAELDTVKNSALEQLRPLIEKLDLEPADKFDKYLMMLRASDDAALIKPAFDAAQGIEGEKEKAQALLDIINEINYITANQQN